MFFDFSVLLELALLSELCKLVMELLRFLGGSIDSFCFAFIDQNFVEHETVEQSWVHVVVRLCF